MKKIKKKLLFIIIPILILIGAAAGVYFYVNSTIQDPTEPDSIFIDPQDKEAALGDEEKGLINILLVGIDARPGETTGRTDSIILATIDTNNKKVKLTSFMRDMYVRIPGRKQNRINAAYEMGGPELLIKTINDNFNLNVQYFVSINFSGFQDVVEKLGGIDVEVKDYEVNEINKYIYEANGAKATLLKGAGYQHLNGQQALSYSRIRKVGNNDYERTERQRRVISLLIDKAKKINLTKIPDLFSTVLPYLKTNVPTTKLMNLGVTVYKFGNLSIEDIRLPADGMFQSMKIEIGSTPSDVLVPDLERNVAYLDRFIYSSAGSVAANMPSYMVNNYHANDIALDKRGKKKAVVPIEVPKPIEKPVEPEVDKNPPSIPTFTLKQLENGFEVTLNSTDDIGVVSYEYSLDNITWKTGKTFTVTESGTVFARVKDAAGNMSSASKQITVEKKPVEKPVQAPSITVTQIEEGVNVTIKGAGENAGITGFEYSYDNKNWINYKESLILTAKFIKDNNISVIYARAIGPNEKRSGTVSEKISIKTTSP